MKAKTSFSLIICALACVACNKMESSLEQVEDVCTKIPDENFRTMCYAEFDGNQDGRFSMDEAAAVSVLSNTYWNNVYQTRSYDIASLEGIEYFTGLKEIIMSHSRMAEIDVSRVTWLQKLSISDCYYLERVVFPDRVGDNFSVRFYNSSSEELFLPEGMTSLTQDSIMVPIGLKKLCLPSTLKSVASGALEVFGHYTLTVLAMTPPSLEGDIPKPDHIYVPTQSVDAYKKAWSDYAGIISVIK